MATPSKLDHQIEAIWKASWPPNERYGRAPNREQFRLMYIKNTQTNTGLFTVASYRVKHTTAIHLGVSLISTKDNFSKYKGREYAIERAIRCSLYEDVHEGNDIHEFAEEKTRRYSKAFPDKFLPREVHLAYPDLITETMAQEDVIVEGILSMHVDFIDLLAYKESIIPLATAREILPKPLRWLDHAFTG